MGATASQYVDLMTKDFSKVWDDTLVADEPYFNEVVQVLQSNNQYERMSGLAGVAHFTQISEGQEPPESNPKQKYDGKFTHLMYGLISRLTKNAMADDRTGLLREIPRMQAEAGKKTMETIVAAMFDRSQNGSYTGPDGKVLCATDHPRADGGTWSNRPATNADLGVAVLESALTDFESTVDDYGDPAMPVPVMLLINQANRWAATQLLENFDKSGTTNRDINAVKNQFKGLRPFVWPYITDTDSWYLLNEKVKRQIFVYMREALSKRFVTAPDNTLDAIFQSWFRMVTGWVDARGVYGSVGG